MPTATAIQETQDRRIVARTQGEDMGAFRRLFGPWVARQAPYVPSTFSELLKPFVFLDVFDSEARAFTPMNSNPNNLHPHSGLATLTFVLSGAMAYEDTSGARGVLGEGAVEWFHAGGGAWHGGHLGEGGCRGFQLWIALPPKAELGMVESVYLPKSDVPKVGPAAVLLGSYRGVASPLPAPSDITYLGVRLKAGERFRFEPTAQHSVAWAATARGVLRTPERAGPGEAIAFEPGGGPIEIEAVEDAEFVLGSAAPHPHALSLGYYSVHTSPAALRKGEARIREIQARLVAEGRLLA